MKKNYSLLFFLFSLLVSAQDKILFSYDTAGNQVLREICLNCTTSKNVKAIKDLKEEDLQLIDQISYYPNPVSEELYLNWELVDEKKVSQLQVLSMSGQILKTIAPEKGQFTLGFQGYPSGVYFIVFSYNNGEQKTIKILKK
jgi:hypothetical protein